VRLGVSFPLTAKFQSEMTGFRIVASLFPCPAAAKSPRVSAIMTA
jgi:hypothetical protein